MKAKTIGYFKNVENIPYCKAAVDLKVGMGVVLDLPNKSAALPASADEAKACHYIVTNINDKPEQHNYTETLDVLQGEFVRADDLTSVANLELCFANAEINGGVDALNAGDTLVFGTDGRPVKGAATGYKVYFEVIEKTGYMGKGVRVAIRVN